MNRQSHILAFRFHKVSKEDARYATLISSLNSFIEEFDAAKVDETTSTRLLYTSKSLREIWVELLKALYENCSYHPMDKIVIYSPPLGDNPTIFRVTRLAKRKDSLTYRPIQTNFKNYFNKLEPKSNY